MASALAYENFAISYNQGCNDAFHSGERCPRAEHDGRP